VTTTANRDFSDGPTLGVDGFILMFFKVAGFSTVSLTPPTSKTSSTTDCFGRLLAMAKGGGVLEKVERKD
jgi:hypothetical protein